MFSNELNHTNIKEGDIYFMPLKNIDNPILGNMFGKIIHINPNGKIYTNECLFKYATGNLTGAGVEYSFSDFDKVMSGYSNLCEKCFKVD